jgi:NADPH:quinone reductase-like Zn-dependent oxidoreductase
MKAAVYTRNGGPDVVQIMGIEKPVPKDNEVLIRVQAASLNPLDWRLLRGLPAFVGILFRVTKPTPTRPGKLGRDVAGEVETIGKNVTRFKPGDSVFGACQAACAEYACASEATLVLKPDEMSFEQAAALPVAGLSALQGLRDRGKIQPGQKVLINGAAGGVGTFAVQIAKSFGADVTGVCSAKSAEMARSLGADRVIDYAQEDFTKSGQRYDLILDNVGNHSLSALRRALKPRGICVIVGAPKNPGLFLTRVITGPLLSMLVSQKFFMFLAKVNEEDLSTLGELIRSGKVNPVIDKRYPLSETAEAMRYLETGHARGKLIISFG